MPPIDLISLLTNRRRRPVRPGLQMLMPSGGSGGSTNTRHGGGGAPAPTHTDVTSGTGYGGGGGVRSGGAVVTSSHSYTNPAAVPSSGYSAPSSVPAANVITPQRLAALLPAPRQASALAINKPKPRINTLLDQLDRKFEPGETITSRQAALLAEAYGLPGRTYSQIGKGESRLEPAAVGHDPGGTVGLGWLQMTPGVQSPETVAKWDEIASQHPGGYKNPVAQVEMAKVLAGSGTGVSNYYGTGYVTDPNAHLRGGQQRAQRVLGMPASGSTGRRQLSTSELFYDPGVNLVDNQPTSAIGGHDTHVHYGSTDPRSILTAARIAERKGADVRENPLFDPVDPVHTQGSMHYESQRLPRNLVDLARKLGGTGRQIGEAIDIQGSPQQLSAVDRALARRSGAAIGSPPASMAGGIPAAGGSAVLSNALSTVTGGGTPTRRQSNTLASLLGVGGGSGGSFGGGRPPVESSLLTPAKPQPRTRSAQDEENPDDQQALLELLASLGYA